MSPEIKHLYKFKNFILDVEEKVLRREGKTVSLTPKAYDLLKVLVLGHGRILEKETLMNEVWAESFVEESNLAFTIRQLRKVLNDDAKNPVFIETVPRRGYRFIAEVEQISTFDDVSNVEEKISTLEKNSEVHPNRKNYYIPIAVGILLVGTFVLGAWFAKSKTINNESNILSSPFSLEKISTNGKVFHAVITPDGKNFIYTNQSGGKHSIWLRQIDSSNNVEIIPLSDGVYGGLAVSPDSNNLYFSRKDGKSNQFDIYRVPVFGGIPKRLVSATQGWLGVSPDDGKISYVRCFYTDQEACSLWIADSTDGKNEKKLISRKMPFRIAVNKFSPDGKSIAFAVGQSENASNEFSVSEVELESGKEREITKEKFFNIKGLAWLPNKSGLLVTASRIPNKNFLIWQVSYSSGAVKSLTNDSQTYSALSLDNAASYLASTTIREDFRMHLFNAEKPSGSKILIDASTAYFAAPDKILFSSTASGNEEIWTVNSDGNGQKQLTSDISDDSKPVFSPFDNFIYFASNRTGEIQIWRMNSDGSDQIQITRKEGGFPLSVSPDGEWIFYQHGLDRTLRRVSKNGDKDEIIWNSPAYRFAVSPDATQAAFVQKKGNGRVLQIISVKDKQITETIQPAIINHKMPEIVWMADGNGLFYILTDENYLNHTLWQQSLTGQKPQKLADLGDDEISESSGFTASPDGKSLIYIQGGWRHDAVLLKGLN